MPRTELQRCSNKNLECRSGAQRVAIRTRSLSVSPGSARIMVVGVLTPGAFIAKWRRSELKERSASQEHFLDLCRLLGEPTPAEADPAGA